jgi:soluble lytic murein transglycosylase
LPRLTTLLAVSCLGTTAALVGGRQLLSLLPPLNPTIPASNLERQRRWAPDPARRREASLLLLEQAAGDRQRQASLLIGQGWGRDGLAAVVLKQQAQRAEARQQDREADRRWQQLLRRFPASPASADALYALGRQDPALRRRLLEQFPAHPAALAAALEEGPAPADRLTGALHLARWGARWPGADGRIRQVCGRSSGRPSLEQRADLAAGLAELGAGQDALACLGGDAAPTASQIVAAPAAATAGAAPTAAAPAMAQANPSPRELAALSPRGALLLAEALAKGDGGQKALVAPLLLQVVKQQAQGPEAEQAVRRLSQEEGAGVDAQLASLPPPWRQSAPVQAHRALADPSGRLALEVMNRWPDDAASWDLQWELARKQLLAGQWGGALTVLQAIGADRLPPMLAARHRFWKGFSQHQLGQDEGATATWRELLLHHPGGYYGWRASVQLGEGDLQLQPGAVAGATLPAKAAWSPLASGDGELDRLWRLNLKEEAWETWRTRRGKPELRASRDLLLEGRLRQAVGDDWTGLHQIEEASAQLRPDQCELLPAIERGLHPVRFGDDFAAAASPARLHPTVPLGVARQESRFTPGVSSVAGAVGLMQLLPTTASELAGRPINAEALKEPALNTTLGSRYLRQLLDQAKGNPFLAVASYNAGPGAAQGWVTPLLQASPELWVEAIPFPETRLYVKKVLGNIWSYQQTRQPSC